MININLIAERRARKLREITILRTSILVAISVALIMVLMNVWAMITQFTAKNELAYIKQEIEVKQPRYAKVLQIETEINEKEPLVNLLEQVQASESAWMTIMTDLTRVLPKNVVIDRITARTEKTQIVLAISGRARDEDTLGKFMLNLSELTAWAETPVLQSTDNVGKPELGEMRHFNLIVPVRGMVGGNL